MSRGSNIKWLSGALVVCAPASVLADPTGHSANPTSIFAPASTPAQSIAPQIYGSRKVELAWIVIPVLIVVGLFLAPLT